MDGRTKQGVVACTRLKIRNKSTINHEMHIQKHVLKKKTPIYTFFQSARAAFIGSPFMVIPFLFFVGINRSPPMKENKAGYTAIQSRTVGQEQ